MPDIAELGFSADTRQLEHAEDALLAIPPAADKAEKASGRLSVAFEKSGTGVNRFVKTVNSGFQNVVNFIKTSSERSEHFVEHLAETTERVGEVIGENFKAIAVGLGSVFAVTELVGRLTETAEALDEISKASKQTQQSIASITALKTAGELADVSMDAITSTTKRMNRELAKAEAQGKGTAGVYKVLGVSAKQLAAMPVDERFAVIADKLKSLGLDAGQTALVLAKLGDRSGALIPLLSNGGDEIRKASEEVKKFGLSITSLQGDQIEEMNDNFTRLGYSVQGAFNQFIAFIAPTVGALLLAMANGIVFLVQNIGTLEPVLSVVGPALLVAFGPVILAAIVSLASAIASGLVGAIASLSAAIYANPLLALAVVIVGIIAAVWRFRDAIKQTFGVDIQAIVTAAGNFIVQTMMGGLAQVQFIWNNFPSIVAKAVVQAANFANDALNSLIGKAVEGINGLIDTVNKLGANIPSLDAKFGQSGPITFDDSTLTKNATDLAATLDKINKTDYVGMFASNLKAASAAETETSENTKDLNTNLDALGSGADGASTKAEKLKKVMEALKDTQEAAKQKAKELYDVLDNTVGSAFRTFFDGLKQGRSVVDSLADAISNLADNLLQMVENAAIQGILNSIVGGVLGGGFGTAGLTGAAAYGGGGIYPGITGPSLLANGGVMSGAGISAYSGTVVSKPTLFPFAKGTGLMGEAGAEAVLPLERGPGGKLGVSASDAGGGGLVVNVYNEAGDSTEASAVQNDDGSLSIYIDKKMAENANNRGSRFHSAMRGTFGLSAATKARG